MLPIITITDKELELMEEVRSLQDALDEAMDAIEARERDRSWPEWFWSLW